MESTLSLPFADLQAEVGRYLGYGRDPKAWDANQADDVLRCVQEGYRQFLTPPLVEGLAESYEWSFIRASRSLTLSSGTSTVALPDDFASLDGNVTLTSPANQMFFPIPFVGIGKIDELFARYPSTTGQPEYVTVRPIKGTTATRGQREEFYVYPTADQDYTLQFMHHVLPDALNDAMPYHYGGSQHASTVRASCLAVAEYRNDGDRGVEWQNFADRLKASISADRRLKPALIGYNGDRTNRQARNPADRHYAEVGITFNGTSYP